MNYEQKKHKIRNIWDLSNSSKNELDIKNNKNELLKIEEKRNTFEYNNRITNQYETNWFILEQGSGNYAIYFKATKFTITNFPLQLLPNIRTIVYFKCIESVYESIYPNICNVFEVIDMDLDEDIKTVAKTINIWNEILFDNNSGDTNHFQQIYAKLVITIANPRDYI